ncbi:MAG: glycosyltransferase [Acidimicrobiia bacterium]|nr:glycosyltransferase [Acidimicrobiia bacterium]
MSGGPIGPVLFVTWNGGGNVTPVLALARGLLARGTEVTVLGEPSMAHRFADTGVHFLPCDERGLWDPPATAAEVHEACTSLSPDVVVIDYMMPTALCGAEAAGVTTVALVHTLYGALLVDGAPGPIFMAADVDAVNEVRRRHGLDQVDTMGDLLDRSAMVMVPCPPELDGAVDEPAANVRYVAPLLDTAGSGDGWTRPPGDEPLVVVSLGTTPMDEEPVLARVLEALGGLPVRVVATVGDHVDPTSIAAPPNCSVSGHVPHTQLMAHAAVVITHAGLGTVLASLGSGLPMVCLPLGREQPDNAAAVVRVGAGIALSPEAAPAGIADAVSVVLDEPRYAEQAAAMGTRMQSGPDPVDELIAAARGT